MATQTTTRTLESQARHFDEIAKLLMKVQAQEHATAEKVLEGQGELLKQRLKEIDDKYAAFQSLLRVARELVVQHQPIEAAKADLERRELVLQASRWEVEKLQADTQKREAELQAKLADLDLARKLNELQEQQTDLETRVKVFQGELELLEKQKKDVEREWEKIAASRANLTKEIVEREKALEEGQDRLKSEVAAYRKRVEEEVFAAIQKSFVDLIRSHFRESGPA